MSKCYRHGDLIIREINEGSLRQQGSLRKKLNHLILAEGEATSHKHEIVEGDAELFEENSTLYLRVKSKEAKLTHPEHDTIIVPEGTFEVKHQREYVPEESVQRERRVFD